MFLSGHGLGPCFIMPLPVLALVRTGCCGGGRAEEPEDAVPRLEQGNARLGELRGGLAMEDGELRRATEEKDGEDARLRLILPDARSAAESLGNGLSMGNGLLAGSGVRHPPPALDG